MLVYWEQSANGLQEDNSNMDMENEDNEKQQPQIWGNEKKQMEDSKVKTILILKLHMMK